MSAINRNNQSYYPPVQNGKEKRPGLMTRADKVKLDTLAQMGQWFALPYAANWSDWGAGETAGAYRYDGLGCVQLRGLVKKSVALVAGDIICTLPVGYRPVTEWIFMAASAAGYTEIRVNTGGAVYIQAGGSAVFTSLAQVRFDPAF